MPAKQFDHDVDIRPPDQCCAVTGNKVCGYAESTVRLKTAIRDGRQFERSSQLARIGSPVAAQQFDHSAPHGATSEQGNPYRFQDITPPPSLELRVRKPLRGAAIAAPGVTGRGGYRGSPGAYDARFR